MNSQNGSRRWVSIGIVGLTVATALIHFYLNVLMGRVDLLFTLNGIGYLGLIGLMYLPIDFIRPYRRLARLALIVFTLVTIAAWAAFGSRDILGYTDKAIEVALVLLLFKERP